MNPDPVANFIESTVLVEGERVADFLVLCEHAGNRIPPWLPVPEHERHWLDTHWGYDLGAGAVARAVAQSLGTTAVLAEFSRLVCDPNRPLGSDTWIRKTVEEGYALSFNARVPPEQEDHRRALWAAYHRAVDRTIRASLQQGVRPFLFSVHSMTHLYVGHARDMELAVLFSDFDHTAESLAQGLERHGFRVARNEPYSARDGLAYSVERHGRAHHLPHLEIEVRQDLLDTEGQACAIGSVVARALRAAVNATFSNSDDRREAGPAR